MKEPIDRLRPLITKSDLAISRRAPVLSVTMKAAPISSTVQGGGKRRAGNSHRLLRDVQSSF